MWIIIWQVANGIAVAGLIAALCKLHQSSSMHPGQLSLSPPMSFSFSSLIAALCKSSPPITYIHHFYCHRHHFYCHLRCHSVLFLTLFKHQVGISSHSAPGRCSMNLFTLRSAIIITIVAIIIASVVIISLRTCGITFFILLSAYQQKISTLRHLHKGTPHVKKNVFFRALPEWGGGGGPCPN